MHIASYENNNKPIVPKNSSLVPLNYFNIVKLKSGERFVDRVSGYETCVVPATGSIDVSVNSYTFKNIGGRVKDVWDGEPEAVYVPSGEEFEIHCCSNKTEVFVAGAKFDEVFSPFEVRSEELDVIQYGSDDTKTHRKIKHILGQKQSGRVGRLLVSELFTVGAGGWSGFPSHKHDTDRLPIETRHDETYNFP